ncbi:MAG: hypothetical protein ACI3X7_05780 [Bacteroidaceae bacterium]
MKRVLLSIAIMCSALCGGAQNQSEPSLAVTTKDGQTALYALSGRPLVTFNGDDVVIKTTSIIVSYKFADLETFVIINNLQDEDAIRHLTADATEFEVTSKQLVANRLMPGEEVRVFNTDGKLIATGKANDAGMAKVSLDGISAGVVIVKTQSFTYKIQKR